MAPETDRDRDTAAVTGPVRGPRATGVGPGRVLVAVYALFVLAAGSRAAVQLATHYHRAPLAYLLSAVAAVIYLTAMLALSHRTARARRLAWCACAVEFTGVIVIGIWTVLDRHAFPDQTVWSEFGRGYGFVPLVLPILGLLWLRRTAVRPG
jgi:hypothetical protein